MDIDLALVRRQILCGDGGPKILIDLYGLKIVTEQFHKIKKEDFLEEYGTTGFDIIYDTAEKELIEIHKSLKEHPELWI